MTTPADQPAAQHAHGMDCCWDCHAGKPTHPLDDEDDACEERADGTGRCCYRKEPDA